MRKSMHKLFDRLPLHFRTLYRQFLLRVVDLEALSIDADIPRFLGQFAGVLIMLSMIHAVRVYIFIPLVPWDIEQYLIATMMLVVGLITVISWDATFPDRRDVVVLSPLPIAPRMILLAKVTASATLLGIAILTLNFASGIVCSLLLGSLHNSVWGFFQSFAAYWFTMIAASLFLHCSVLTVQGFTALLLPRRLFLRLSAILQLVAFIFFLGMYFLQPSLPTPAAMALPENHWVLACFPLFWFFALFNQINGSLPSDLAWLAWRAWISLGVVIFGATASLLLCYLRTMKKTVEEPDLVPRARGSHWAPSFGSRLRTAVVLFSIRSLTRSRQHRVAFAFFLALVLAVALSSLKAALATDAPRPLQVDFLMSTLVMMNLAVVGLRGVFSLPISLNANWVLRLTQLCPSEKYIAATRWALLLLAVFPVWLCTAILSLLFRPLHESAAHLVVLALVGFIMADLSQIGVSKIPFACSYLPGKSNVQYMFWAFLIIVVPVAISFSEYEQRALLPPFQPVSMTGVLGAADLGLWTFNRHRAKSAVLYYEELPPEVITPLGLASYGHYSCK
jgi:hypothetical protein